MKLIGVDVGGTFTDVIYTDTGDASVHSHKVPSTPDDPSRAVLEGILGLCSRFDIAPREIQHIYHGTTVATNAVLESNGARVGMLTTAGYRDILHIGRHQRPQHYSIQQEIPWQDRELVARRYRKTVRERLRPPDGAVEIDLDEDAIADLADEYDAAGIEAIAVCFLFSYLNPAHEQRVKTLLQAKLPTAFVTTSADVAPQFREFERFTTCVMNAYVGPIVADYVARLADRCRAADISADLHIMRSNGGIATPRQVVQFPVHTLLSGPAAGVLGGAWTGRTAACADLITFDVGGTSADIGVINAGRYSEATARDAQIAGFPLLVPMIDVHTIGTGGGSIAKVDAAGGFQVGPQSAGAVPGPAAYGRGGKHATLTDANLVLGRLVADNFLGGEMSLDVGAARRVLESLGEQLSLPPHETAAGIITVANNDMANAIRARTVQKGIDVRDYALVAFGGGGPLQAAEVAALIGIREVIIPVFPGINSALGLLTTDLLYDAVKTQFQFSHALDVARLRAAFDSMETEINAQFAADGISLADIEYKRAGDLRYAGQGYELRIDIPMTALGVDDFEHVFNAFHRLHEAEYGHAFPANTIEIVNVRLSGIGSVPKLVQLPSLGEGELADAITHRDAVMFQSDGGIDAFDTVFYRRDKLPRGAHIDGPAIVLQNDTTTLVPPAFQCWVDDAGNLRLSALNHSAP